MVVIKCCEMCSFYVCEEIGDSDYGGVYAKEPSCSKHFDLDENEEEIKEFDRKAERDCCELEFWLVVEADKEIEAAFDLDMQDDSGNYDKSYQLFQEKYKLV